MLRSRSPVVLCASTSDKSYHFCFSFGKDTISFSKSTIFSKENSSPVTFVKNLLNLLRRYNSNETKNSPRRRAESHYPSRSDQKCRIHRRKKVKKSCGKNVGVIRNFITFVTELSFPKRETFFSRSEEKFPKTGFFHADTRQASFNLDNNKQ